MDWTEYTKMTACTLNNKHDWLSACYKLHMKCFTRTRSNVYKIKINQLCLIAISMFISEDWSSVTLHECGARKPYLIYFPFIVLSVIKPSYFTFLVVGFMLLNIEEKFLSTYVSCRDSALVFWVFQLPTLTIGLICRISFHCSLTWKLEWTYCWFLGLTG